LAPDEQTAGKLDLNSSVFGISAPLADGNNGMMKNFASQAKGDIQSFGTVAVL
jgi:hypothetical protein